MRFGWNSDILRGVGVGVDAFSDHWAGGVAAKKAKTRGAYADGDTISVDSRTYHKSR